MSDVGRRLPRWTRALALASAAALVCSDASRADSPERAASFDYLYVEANEGGSSGGHAAVRFGTRTYHFQNRDGLLVLDREPTRDFLHAYALVNNRTVTSSRIALATADAERLRAAFDRRYHTQQRQLDVAKALAEDLALLEAWRDGRSPAVPGLGYFASDAAPSPAVAKLRAAIEARYGPEVLTRLRARANARLTAMVETPPDAWPAPPLADAQDEPPFARPWSRRYRDAASGIAAVDVLTAGAPLDPAGVVSITGPAGWLTDDEIRGLHAAREHLEAALVQLAGSPRADWGRPFLVALARALAIDESLRRGRRVVLAVLPEDAHELPYRVLSSRLDRIGEMILAGRNQTEAARRAFSENAGTSETYPARLEEAVGRVDALETSVRERRGLKLARGTLLPTRPAASRSALPRPADPASLELPIERVRARSARYRASLEHLYRYRLITRNCVSELFATLDLALDRSVTESEQVLGGHVDGRTGFSFIPFASAHAVDRAYRVVDKRVIPSYREIQLAEMRSEESPVWVALRESNTLTARSYRRGVQDSYFVFFTDDTPWLRPLFGAVNLTAAVFESLWGLVRLPVDRGETFVSGLEGALVSLPELAFWNIRKGSNDWVAPRPQSLDGPDQSSEEAAIAARGWSR